MDDSTRLFKFVVSFVYEELLEQFITNKGDLKESTFCLVNWGYVLDSSQASKIYETLDTKTVYKCYVLYLVKLFAKYLKHNDSDLLMHIKVVLHNENLFSNTVPFHFSVTNEFKKLCLKRMANILKNEPQDKNSNNFKSLLKNQDFIEECDLYRDYSIDELFNELCKILTKVKYLNEKSLFKAIFKIYDQTSEEHEITNSLVQSLTNNLSNSRISIHPPIQQTISMPFQQNNQRAFFQNVFNHGTIVNSYNNHAIHRMDTSNEVSSSSNSVRNQHHLHHHNHHQQPHPYNRQNNILPSINNTQITNKVEPISYDDFIPLNTNNNTENDVLRANKVRLIENNNNNNTNNIIELSDISSDSEDEGLLQINLPNEPSNNSSLIKSAKPVKPRKERTQWTETEILTLVYLVEKVGRDWAEIAVNYKSYFQNRNRKSLNYKYFKLEKDKNNLENLKKKAESLNGIEIIEEHKRERLKWTHEETLYLVMGVHKLGKEWKKILSTFKQYFRKDRNRYDLFSKYQNLEQNNPEKLLIFKNEVSAMLKNSYEHESSKQPSTSSQSTPDCVSNDLNALKTSIDVFIPRSSTDSTMLTASNDSSIQLKFLEYNNC